MDDRASGPTTPTLIAALIRALQTAAPALIYGDRTVSRAELSAQAAWLRAGLEAWGVAPGDRVALLCPNHPSFAVAHLAVLAAGAVLVPLNPLYQALELAPLLRDSSPRLLLYLEPCEALAAAAVAALDPADRPGMRLLEDRIEAADLRLEPLELGPEAPAVMIYTSGTTGTAKAAVLSHRNLEHNARYIAREWLGWDASSATHEVEVGGQVDVSGPMAVGSLAPGHCPPEAPHRTLGALPLCHNFGLNVTLDATLLHGGTLVILPRFSAVEALRAIEAHRVSFLPLVPTMSQALLFNPEIDRVDTSSVRLLVSGGAATPGPIRERAVARFPGVALRDSYGLSEASLVSCSSPGRWGKPGTVGRAIEDTGLRVVDATGRPCAAGEVGEVQVRGPGVIADYWRRPSGTPPPVVDGWLSTGDLGILDTDGDLTIVDRKKDLIVRGGYKVYPLEVEEALYRHPAVAEAAVFGMPDPRMGERVMACVAPHPGVSIDGQTLIAHCRRLLAEFKVPSSIEVREALPRGSTGKILRRMLREEAARRQEHR